MRQGRLKLARLHQWLIAAFAALSLLWPGTSLGQTDDPLLASSILIIDQERLFADSAFGRQVASNAEAASQTLQTENRRIEAELVTEERQLTEERPSLSPEEFRSRADAFDSKVQAIRTEQDAKSSEIATRIDEDRRLFFQAIVPVLAQIMRDAGAVVILDKRTSLLSVNNIDITERAVEQIDRVFAEQGIFPTPIQQPEGAEEEGD
ncbi:MAG: OmpH family outer membrane protein [Pseudomonadota bacterium]